MTRDTTFIDFPGPDAGFLSRFLARATPGPPKYA
jgi:hypothetical protein